ncbi:kinase-like protein [Wilcoxina mikolae CBS 423.85]|nr:kinase-like protein [Wilcoxina mikolae CBS 423.85]
MEYIRQKLRQKRVEGSHSRYFLPEADLLNILSEGAVAEALEECNIAFYIRNEVLQTILEGGRGELISDFIENDQLHNARTRLDSKLHFEKDSLKKILVSARKESNDVADFYETQWEVLAPILRSGAAHRTLHDNTIFPFIENEVLSTQGGFGVAWKTTLHPTQQNLVQPIDGAKVIVMRKEIRRTISKNPKASHEEDRILSSLRCLKHPCIITLLASYSYKGVHNLLFPLAYSDLHRLLNGEIIWPPQLQTPEAILSALHGLASAIESVHSFFVDEFKVGFIGCHYDLKPKNVLIDDARFLLADFGLSRLRPDDEDSKSLSKRVNGDYWAPECENIMEGFVKQKIGRSSDVWSFGCILLEVVAYLRSGPAGVKDLKGKRKSTFWIPGYGEWTTHTFHQDGLLHPKVGLWISAFGKESDLEDHIRGLLRLVWRVLNIDPAKRPRAKDISKTLFLLATKSKFQQTGHKFDNLLLLRESGNADKVVAHGSRHLDLMIERKRFEIWGQAVGLEKDFGLGFSEHETPWLLDASNDADRISNFLNGMDDEIYSLHCSWDARILIPTYFQLRKLNDKLWKLLPETLVRGMESRLEDSMLDTENPSVLRQTENTFRVHTIQNYKNIGILAALKYQKALFDGDKCDDGMDLLNPDQTLVQLEDPNCELDTPSFGVVRGGRDNPDQRFLIEWMPYKDIWGESVRKQLLDRVRAIARLSNRPNINQPGLQVLRCAGFYENTGLRQRAFGLLYAIPLPGNTTAKSKLITLKDLLESEGHKPVLGDRFELARKVAYCLLEVHKVGWLHKNISAYNIAFFRPVPQDSPCLAFTTSPYLIGFNHSRPNDPRILTEGVGSDRKKLKYQHPEYLRKGHGFHPVYDYYSIGLVLLEIGVWRSLDAMLSSDKMPPKLRSHEKVEYLRKEFVPLLGQRMGTLYRDAVDACLTGDFPERGNKEIHSAFETKVVNPLSRCKA